MKGPASVCRSPMPWSNCTADPWICKAKSASAPPSPCAFQPSGLCRKRRPECHCRRCKRPGQRGSSFIRGNRSLHVYASDRILRLVKALSSLSCSFMDNARRRASTLPWWITDEPKSRNFGTPCSKLAFTEPDRARNYPICQEEPEPLDFGSCRFAIRTRKVRVGSRLCKNSGAETFRAIIESGRQRGRIVIAAEANFMTQYFVSVSRKSFFTAWVMNGPWPGPPGSAPRARRRD